MSSSLVGKEEAREVRKVLLSLPADLAGALDDAAAREGRAKSHLAAEALEAYLRSRGATGLEPGLAEAHAAYRRHRERLDQALAEVELSVAEASLLCEVLNGCDMQWYMHPDPETTVVSMLGAGSLVAEVSDACRLNGLDRKWGADGAALVRRLAQLTPLQALAVLDAAERFWEHQDAETGCALRMVGLVRG